MLFVLFLESSNIITSLELMLIALFARFTFFIKIIVY